MRILVSKPDSLGDQLIVAGWLQALARAQPDALVLWHVRAGIQEAAALLVGVSVFTPDFLASPTNEAARLHEIHRRGLVMIPVPLNPFGDWSRETEIILSWWETFLAAHTWDIAIAAVGNRTWVAETTVAISKATCRIGAAASSSRQIPVNGAGHLLSRLAPIFTHEVALDIQDPEVHSLGRLVAASGLIPEDERTLATLNELTGTAPDRARTLLLAPGVGGPRPRAWSAKSFLELARQLRSEGWSVEWIEGPADAAFFTEIRSEEESPIHTFGPGELTALAALLLRVRGLVCNDTAYAHLAALLGVPTVAVFGGGQGKRFHPQQGRVKVVQGLPACSGCQWHCVYTSYPCVADIPVSLVLQALRSVKSEDDSRPTTFVPPWAEPRSGSFLIETLQQEILHLDADRFARLQIVQTLLDQLRRASFPVAVPAVLPPSVLPCTTISVVIPMGRPERGLPTLDALAQQISPAAKWEVIVAGAGAQSIPSAYPGLSLHRALMTEAGSPSQTRNAGVSLASGEWLLFVDDDIRLAPDFLVRAAALIDRSTGGNTASPIAAFGARLPGRSGKTWERLTDLSNFWSQQGTTPRDSDWLYSAALLVRADAYRAAGGFDPDLAVGEDVDLCRRLVQGGHLLRYEPSLVAYHDHRRDTPLKMWRYFWKNGEGARFFFRALGGVCPFSVKTVWLKAWSDLRLNQAHQRREGEKLGWRTPLIWLNYLIVETSLEWHWQRHLRSDRRYLSMPVRAPSDATAAKALKAFDDGRHFRGIWLCAVAIVQDFSNPLRR